MSTTFRDRYRMTVTSPPSTTGDFIIGTAYPGFHAFTSSDNGLLFDIIVNDGTTDWEIRKDCSYSAGTLSRGTFVDSSTGSPLTLSINSVLAVTLLAQRTLPVTITAPASGDAVQYNGTDWVNAPISTSIVRQVIKNASSSNSLTKGQAVYVSGADGTNVLVSLAKADAEFSSSKTLGLLLQDLAPNGQGYVITEGKISGQGASAPLDTSTATVGNPVWLSPTTAGGLIFGLANKPHAPNHLVYIGVVTRVHAVNGEIFVKPQNGFELDELHDVYLTGQSNNDMLFFEASTSLWKNRQLTSSDVTTALGFTPSTGTVTSVTATSPLASTGGTTPNLTIVQADATHDGYLTTSDWNTFNGKQNALSAANASVSGYLTSADWTTFNNKQPALGFVPYDSANPAGYTSNTGTVTNVTATGPISVATGTTTPAITISQATTSTAGYLSSTDWNTFNNKLSSVPIASASTLGGIKVGTGLSIAGDGTLSASGTATVLFTKVYSLFGSIVPNTGATKWFPHVPITIIGAYLSLGVNNTAATTVQILLNNVIQQTITLAANTSRSTLSSFTLTATTSDYISVNVTTTGGQNLSLTMEYNT